MYEILKRHPVLIFMRNYGINDIPIRGPLCTLKYYNKNCLFTKLCVNNRVDLVKYMLQKPCLTIRYTYIFQNVCGLGHLEIVKLLAELKFVKPSANNNYALQMACAKGHVNVVEFLLSIGVIPDILSIGLANTHNHPDIVKILTSN